ncbi:MAG: DNA polymerase III subunit delta' [Thermoanaerobacteraceae bacterium]|nr:DNA polymerase III subunit delta' [Thermoanaerobacteraceae bacterium]
MKLERIIGHEHIVTALRRVVEEERVAHAYLFAGPSGVGKTTVAGAFAAALLCRQPRLGDACGQCRDCLQVAGENHPDLHRILPEGSSIKIEQVREMLRRLVLRPYQGERQVHLVMDADLMTAGAANCLLKTLEEPPPGAVLILITARPQALLPTVVSRCQVFTFHPLPVAAVAAVLDRELSLPPAEAQTLARLSGGCPGRALQMAAVEGGYGAEREKVLELAVMMGRATGGETLSLAASWAEDKQRALVGLELLQMWYRDLLVWRETGDGEMLINRDRREAIAREAARYDRGGLLSRIRAIEETRNSLAVNVNTRLALEMLFLGLAGTGSPAVAAGAALG